LDKLLDGEGAVQWGKEFAFALVALSGARVGIRRVGIAAVDQVARLLAKSHRQSRRGTTHRNLAQAIAKAFIEGGKLGRGNS
jgi:hypothetical protein